MGDGNQQIDGRPDTSGRLPAMHNSNAYVIPEPKGWESPSSSCLLVGYPESILGKIYACSKGKEGTDEGRMANMY